MIKTVITPANLANVLGLAGKANIVETTNLSMAEDLTLRVCHWGTTAPSDIPDFSARYYGYAFSIAGMQFCWGRDGNMAPSKLYFRSMNGSWQSLN